MEIDIQPLHYGHSDGHTDITYSEDGERLISCGGDGDVRIWNGFDDDDPLQTCLGEFILCTKQKGDFLIVAADNSKVQLVQFPNGERDGLLTRFTAQVNHIATSPSHTWLAIGSDDMTIQVIEFESKKVTTLSPLKGSILSLAIDHNHKHIAVSCGDGSLKIIEIESENVIKELAVVPKVNSFENAEFLCRCDFDTQNKYFAYPHEDKVIFLDIDDWSEAFALSAKKVPRAYSIVSFSSSSKYLAASTLEGDIVVWNVPTQTVSGYLRHPKEIAITAICWNPKENGDLAFTDNEGYIGLAVNCCSSDIIPTNSSKKSNEFPTEANDDDGNKSDADVDDEFRKAFADDNDDEDNENAISLEKLKNDVMGVTDDKEDKESLRSHSPRARSRTPEPPLQQAFMPSSTPEHLDPRYMCWNEVGIIRCYGSSLGDEEEGTRSIEVEFHDATLHNSMMMANFNNYSMGSISTAALAVANSSTINVVPLGSSSKEWNLEVPEDVEIIALASSHNLICFGTNRNLIHICTIYGIQKAVLSCPGPIVCMTAFGHVLMVAYHAGNWRKNDQCVEIMLVKLEGTSIESRDLKSALGPESSLQWIGFTDVGTPSMMDSNGLLFVHPLQSNIWLPFCDTKKHAKGISDGFFVTAVYESLSTVRGIRCRGSFYPGFTPVPTLTELELAPPFLNMDTEKHQLEANLYTWSILQVEDTSKRFKEAALKAFALAAKNNFDQRALELMEMLQNPSILNLGLKYVNKLDKKRLAEKLIELATTLNSADADEQIEEISTPSNIAKPNRKLILKSSSKLLNRTGRTTPVNSPITTISTDISQETLASPLTTITPQDTSILNDEPKNPFLKSLKKNNPETYNPLSLTDKYAGYNVEKENKNASTEKRKLSDTSPADKGKEKQRKLDKFMFAKRT